MECDAERFPVGKYGKNFRSIAIVTLVFYFMDIFYKLLLGKSSSVLFYGCLA